MMIAPTKPMRMNPYMARAERRVKSHITVSKLNPRLFNGSVRLVSIKLTSPSRADDAIDRKYINWNEDKPFQPNRLTLILYQAREEVKDGDA